MQVAGCSEKLRQLSGNAGEASPADQHLVYQERRLYYTWYFGSMDVASIASLQGALQKIVGGFGASVDQANWVHLEDANQPVWNRRRRNYGKPSAAIAHLDDSTED
ncbi:hypothetical protein FIBSPDRAFT_936516 [Athelia psychrophila]|uniref:Uncharacterized protein n=1 Tax=Athelia psychrophila TaxID=1759441 RepID=A0A166C091_9AGAM|nr:hypothetical protein FIBSPDRAFT_936516 [Fibularhizoctonia sp. CBS 109695]